MSDRIIYVTGTAILVLETLVGAFMDLAHLPYVVQDVPRHRLSNLRLVHRRSLEGPRSRCAALAATPSTERMGLCRSLL